MSTNDLERLKGYLADITKAMEALEGMDNLRISKETLKTLVPALRSKDTWGEFNNATKDLRKAQAALATLKGDVEMGISIVSATELESCGSVLKPSVEVIMNTLTWKKLTSDMQVSECGRFVVTTYKHRRSDSKYRHAREKYITWAEVQDKTTKVCYKGPGVREVKAIAEELAAGKEVKAPVVSLVWIGP